MESANMKIWRSLNELYLVFGDIMEEAENEQLLNFLLDINIKVNDEMNRIGNLSFRIQSNRERAENSIHE